MHPSQPLSFWNGVLTYPDHEGVAMDTHIYTIFSVPVSVDLSSLVSSNCRVVQEEQMTQAQHISTVCGKQSELSSFDLWVIVGEWTPGNVTSFTGCPFSHTQ